MVATVDGYIWLSPSRRVIPASFTDMVGAPLDQFAHHLADCIAKDVKILLVRDALVRLRADGGERATRLRDSLLRARETALAASIARDALALALTHELDRTIADASFERQRRVVFDAALPSHRPQT